MTICKIYVSKYIDMSGCDNIHWAIDYRATSLLGYYPIVLLSSWVSFSRATIPRANVRLGCRTLGCCLFGLLSVPSAKCPLAQCPVGILSGIPFLIPEINKNIFIYRNSHFIKCFKRLLEKFRCIQRVHFWRTCVLTINFSKVWPRQIFLQIISFTLCLKNMLNKF